MRTENLHGPAPDPVHPDQIWVRRSSHSCALRRDNGIFSETAMPDVLQDQNAAIRGVITDIAEPLWGSINPVDKLGWRLQSRHGAAEAHTGCVSLVWCSHLGVVRFMVSSGRVYGLQVGFLFTGLLSVLAQSEVPDRGGWRASMGGQISLLRGSSPAETMRLPRAAMECPRVV